MKLLHCLVLLLALAVSPRAFSDSVTGKVKEVDAAKGTFTVVADKGKFHNFQVKPNTEVSVKGRKVTLKELTAGTEVQVTTGTEAGFATRILSPPPGAKPQKMAPTKSTVKVPATASKAKPFVVGAVTAGQTVTITPKKVWWTGGGSKKDEFVDWNGYAGSNEKGNPWMAFIAAVGDSTFGAKGATLTFTVPADGDLVLYANDRDAGGNKGSAEVVVETSLAIPR